MLKKLRVEYNKGNCIGTGRCIAIAPDNFELLDKKTTLKNSKNTGKNIYSLELNCDEAVAKNLIKAGKACPANAIRVIDAEKNKDIVNVRIKDDNAKEVIARYDDAKEFVIDDIGYFLIRLDRKNKNIEVAFCKEKNKIVLKITGKKPIDIYQTILNKEKLDIRKDHAAYLGRELEKAYIALKNNLEYVQDDELDLNKKFNQ